MVNTVYKIKNGRINASATRSVFLRLDLLMFLLLFIEKGNHPASLMNKHLAVDYSRLDSNSPVSESIAVAASAVPDHKVFKLSIIPAFMA